MDEHMCSVSVMTSPLPSPDCRRDGTTHARTPGDKTPATKLEMNSDLEQPLERHGSLRNFAVEREVSRATNWRSSHWAAPSTSRTRT